MENIYTVYRLIFPNGKVYIGKTKLKPEKRWKKGEGYRSQKVYSAIQEFGWDNIQKEIIENKLTKKEAEDLEAKYIREAFNNHNAYNEISGVERLEQKYKDSLKRNTEEEKNKNEKIRQATLYIDEVSRFASYVKDIIGNNSSRKMKWLYKGEEGITPEEEEKLRERLIELKKVCSNMVNLDVD